MTDQITLLLTLLCLVLVIRSWYIHFMIKDGLARLMLLWGCGLIALFFIFRIVNLFLYMSGMIDLSQSRLMSTYNVWFIFAIVLGQTFLQLRRAERKEDNKLQADKKELGKRRRADKK